MVTVFISETSTFLCGFTTKTLHLILEGISLRAISHHAQAPRHIFANQTMSKIILDGSPRMLYDKSIIKKTYVETYIFLLLSDSP